MANLYKMMVENSNRKMGLSDDQYKLVVYILVILETMLVTFVIVLIPYLIELGYRPTRIDEIWVPILSAFLMSMYSYIRMRNLDIDVKG